MDVVSDKYEKEMFVPEILLSARVMYAALDVLMPHLKAEDQRTLNGNDWCSRRGYTRYWKEHSVTSFESRGI